MEAVDRYLHLVRHTTAVAFGKQEPGPFLLKRPSLSGVRVAAPEQIQFMTVAGTTGIDPYAAEWRILRVEKREGNPYQDRISIGRASNCDLVLRVPFISKVQAHILCESDGKYALRALGKSNPTVVNGRHLEVNATCPLKFGDLIGFGPMHLEFLDSARLYSVLASDARATAAR
ncbi:MAG: FHA domain-containing protein [Myxococcota bacterium]